MEALRVCRTCGEPKSHGEYWRQPGRRDGLQAECKACMSARHAGWRAKNSTPEFLADKVEGGKLQEPLTEAVYAARRSLAMARQATGSVGYALLVAVVGEGINVGQIGRLRPSLCHGLRGDRANRIKGNATADELEAIARWMREATNAQP